MRKTEHKLFWLWELPKEEAWINDMADVNNMNPLQDNFADAPLHICSASHTSLVTPEYDCIFC